MKPKFKLGLSLFALGFLGVLTFLTLELPEAALPEALALQPPFVIQLLLLVNPTLFLLLAVVVGTALHDKVNLSVPTLSALLGIERPKDRFKFGRQLKCGMVLGLLAGTLMTGIALVFALVISEELQRLESTVAPTWLVRLGYGGITEELLLRFGLMTGVVWAASKLTRKLNNTSYWVGIVLSAAVFALAHFPAVWRVLPQPSALLLTYIFLGNTVGGLFFGWLYWKRGLEAACIAHMSAHLAMLGIAWLDGALA